MAIRPVDMQAVMPRAMEVSNVKANENARPNVENHQFAQQVAKNVANEQQTVVSSSKSEGQQVNKDGKGNGQAFEKRRSRSGDRSKKDNEKLSKEKKSMLDISL